MEHDDDEDLGVEVSPQDLDPETLRRVLEDVTTRDGTDYGEVETPLDLRVTQLLARIRAGEARIVWSARTQTINVVHVRDLQAHGRKNQG